MAWFRSLCAWSTVQMKLLQHAAVCTQVWSARQVQNSPLVGTKVQDGAKLMAELKVVNSFSRHSIHEYK